MIRLAFAVLILAMTACSPLASGAAPATRPTVDYFIIVTGGELLAGAFPDAHVPFITRTLRPLGLNCVGAMTVDDHEHDIAAALRFAVARGKLVIVTGGLGPTDNDVTADALARFTGIELREHPDVIARMEKRFGTPRDQIRPNLRKQARAPVKGTYLNSAGGTAVGLVFEADAAVVVALPGPPRELQPMVQLELAPYLGRKFGTGQPGPSVMIRFVGIGQSQISQTIHEKVKLPDGLITGSTFEGGRVDFTFTLPGNGPERESQLIEFRRQVADALRPYVYAEDETTLEEHVLALLRQRRATLAIAEVGTGGSVAAAIDGAPSADQVLAGAYVAPTMQKLRKSVGGQGNDLRQIAEAAARLAEANWVIAISELKGEGAAAHVEVILKMPDKTVLQRIPLRGPGDAARAAAETAIMDLLRQQLK